MKVEFTRFMTPLRMFDNATDLLKLMPVIVDDVKQMNAADLMQMLLDSVQHEQQANEALARENIEMSEQAKMFEERYEELAAGVGEMRQILYLVIVNAGLSREWWDGEGLDVLVYDAVMREFGETNHE